MAPSLEKVNFEGLRLSDCRSVKYYEIIEPISKWWSYHKAYKAKERGTQRIYALKEIRYRNEDLDFFPIRAFYEVRILKTVQHKNVIELKEVVVSPDAAVTDDGKRFSGRIYMVLEYLEHDLQSPAFRCAKFEAEEIKCIMWQLLMALRYCHVNQVLHRDIEGTNIFINNEGVLKLAGFGRAQLLSDDYSDYLNNSAIQLYYRLMPPDLLFGVTQHGPAVDIWAAGCLFLELLLRLYLPLFAGRDQEEKSEIIRGFCGTNDKINFPGVSEFPWYKPPAKPKEIHVKRSLLDNGLHPLAVDLLDKMLVLDPAQRISAEDALLAEFFWTDPVPCDPERVGIKIQTAWRGKNTQEQDLELPVQQSQMQHQQPEDQPHQIEQLQLQHQLQQQQQQQPDRPCPIVEQQQLQHQQLHQPPDTPCQIVEQQQLQHQDQQQPDLPHQIEQLLLPPQQLPGGHPRQFQPPQLRASPFPNRPLNFQPQQLHDPLNPHLNRFRQSWQAYHPQSRTVPTYPLNTFQPQPGPNQHHYGGQLGASSRPKRGRPGQIPRFGSFPPRYPPHP